MPEGIKVGSAFIEVRADTSRAKEDLKDFRKKAEKEEVRLGVGANTVAASSQIAHAARDRFVALHVKAVGIPAVEKSLARLSGLRVITDNVTDLGKSLANLDKSAPKIATVATTVTNLGAAVLAGSSNLLGLAGSLASIAPAALVLPGIMGGAAIGVGVLTAALVDTKTVLADLGPAFNNLQDNLSSSFWTNAADPIREAVNTLLPQYEGKLRDISSSMGDLAGYTAGVLQESLGNGVLNTLMDNLLASIDEIRPAIKPIVDAFLALGLTGSQYLPILSSWLSSLAIKFNDFTQAAAADGRLKGWIDTGIDNLKALGSVVGSTSKIFYGLYTAAQAAGGSSLQSLAGGLSRVADVVNGPAFQTGLTTLFSGAHKSMEGLAKGLGPLGSLLSQLVPYLAQAMEISGKLGGEVLGALASGLEKANIGQSLVSMFEGISKGVEAILPAVPALTSAFGKWLETIGKVMGILGPVFGAAIEALAPVFESLLGAIVPVAEVLADTLTSALEKIGPFLKDFVDRVSNFVKDNPQLAAIILAVAGGFTAIASAVISGLPTIIAIVSAFSGFLGSMGGVSTIMTIVRTAFSALLGPIGLIIGALVTAYATSEPFRVAVNKIVSSLMDLVGTIVDSVKPVLSELIDLFKMIIDDAITPLFTAIAEILIPVIDSLKPVIETVFGFIADTISNVMTVIQGIITVVTGLIKGDWTMVWTGIQDIFSGIWNQIKNIVTTAINLVRQIIDTALVALKAIWDTAWNLMKNSVLAIWEGIKTGISTAWNGLKSIVGTGVEWVKSTVSNGFTTVRDTATNLWNGLKDNISWVWDKLLKPVFNSVMNFIKQDVPKAFETGVNSIKTFWDRLKDIAKAPVKFMIDTVYNDGIRGVFNKVMDFIGSGKTMGRLTVPGFRTGGYTGDGGVNDVAGAVHGKEFVFTAEQTRAIGKDKLSAIASGAARNQGAAGGGNMGGYFMGNVAQIARTRAMFLNVANGMAPWNFGGAASLWDGAAGVKVKVGRGQHQAQVNPLERGGGILGFSNNTHIDMSPSWMRTLGANQRRTVAAHEIGHSLGLPHNSGHSIMQPNLGQMAAVPTANDIANLQSLYPGGSGKVGDGEGFNPLKWVTDKITAGIGNMLDRIPGAGKVLEMAVDVAKKMIEIGKKWAVDTVTGHEGGDEGAARIGAGARIRPTVFDGGGMLEQGMVGIHNKRVPDKVLTDAQWTTMKTIADNNNNGSGHGIIEQNNTYYVTIDAASVKDIQSMKDIFEGLAQTARAGRGTSSARIA